VFDQSRPIIVPVGGFLGAGKTRLILSAAQMLSKNGIRVGVVTNDQGEEIVDTEWARSLGLATAEVPGGCVCCNFSQMIAAIEGLLSYEPAVIFIEPVGSCTDISATVLQPLKALYADRFQLAPYTVLVDPTRAREMGGQYADEQMQYLFTQQTLEADLICWSKADLGGTAPGSTAYRNLRSVSAKTEEGVGAWLAEVVGGSLEAGGRLLENIDYTLYAAAEAALGWLNWRMVVKLDEALSPASIAGPLFDGIRAGLAEQKVAILHLKMTDRCESGFLEAGVCRNSSEPEVSGDLTASPATEHEITVNLRAKADPGQLTMAVTEACERLPGQVRFTRQDSFQPGAPKPEHRYGHVVQRGS
jgi:hypothetical protein